MGKDKAMQGRSDMQGIAKAIRTVAALAALACATQLLWQSISFGDEPQTNTVAADTTEKFAQPSSEGFALQSGRFLAGATLELRSEATIEGGDVKLKQICRWSAAEQDAFSPIADLVVAKMGNGVAFRAMTLTDLKSTLSDAGVNLAIIRFSGATHCTITRSDANGDERSGLQEWVNAKMAVGPATQPAAEATLVAPSSTQNAEPAKPNHTLRDRLLADLCERVSLDPNNVEMHFSPGDDKVLNLSEPLFQFDVNAVRVHNIGDVAWDVTIYAAGTKTSSHKTTISAVARVWQEQLLVQRPMLFHQTIRNEDLTTRRALVDRLDGETLLKRDQVVGQLCAHDLQAGTVLTARLVEAAPLAKTGDLVTVTLAQGNVKVTTVVRAMDGGSFGQSIRGKQETTGTIFDVTLTGPKTGEISPESPPQTASANVINN
jgi:flagella basal body P-ring formation protein FlgA